MIGLQSLHADTWKHGQDDEAGAEARGFSVRISRVQSLFSENLILGLILYPCALCLRESSSGVSGR